MNKKLAMSLTSIGLAVGIMGASTLAWFTSQDSAKAHFNTGTIKVAVSPKEDAEGSVRLIDNWIPGDESNREITIENKGTKSIYVRVKFDGNWEEKELNKDNVTLTPDTDWVDGKDGYYYYRNVISKGENKQAVMKLKAALAGSETGNEYQNEKYNLDYKVEAIQADNGAIFEEWPNSPWRQE